MVLLPREERDEHISARLYFKERVDTFRYIRKYLCNG